MKKRIWRFLVTGKNNAFFNMALDEALLFLCLEQKLPPTLRLYQWEPRSVSVGYSQKIKEAVDLNLCENKKIDVVRRITGGRAVLHGDDLTYSLCSSKEHYKILGEGVKNTYEKISLAFLFALEHFHIKGSWTKVERKNKNEFNEYKMKAPCFLSSSRYEIAVNGKKLIGSAQRRFKDGFIQQGSILLRRGEVDLAELSPHKEQKEIIKKSLKKSSIPLEEVMGKNRQDASQFSLDKLTFAIKAGFENFFSVKLLQKELTKKELDLTKKLLKKKYLCSDWNLRC